MTERARVVQTAKGYSFFFLGISCVAFGVAVTASSQLGTSPISSVAYVAHRVSVVGELRPVWSLGATSFVLNCLFFAAQWGIERGDFFKRQFLQLPATFLFGLLIDGFGWTIVHTTGAIADYGYAWRLFACFFGSAIVALGIVLELVGNVLYLPGDGMVKTLSSALKTPFGMTKLSFDVFLTVLSVAISWLAVGRVEGVREGSLVGAIMVGQFARLFHPLVGGLRARCGLDAH